MKVFLARKSLSDESRPALDLQSPENKKNDWRHIGEILRGERPLEEYEPPRLVIEAPDALEWDFHQSGAPYALWSPRALEVLGPYAERCFRFLDAYVNGAKYYLPMRFDWIDCLDLDRLKYLPSPHDPSRILVVKRYAFLESKLEDPLIFSVPQLWPMIYMTTSIPRIAEEAGLRGFAYKFVYDSEAG